MRLTAEQVREGILHPDDGVRRLAADYFTQPRTTDTAVTDTVLAAIAKYGPDEFLVRYRGFAELPHTPTSVQWALGALAARPEVVDARGLSSGRRTLIETFLECPFDLFAVHEAELLALPLTPEERDDFEHRRAFQALSADALWARLREVADALNESDDPWRSREANEADRLTRAIADHPELAERVLEHVRRLSPDEFHFFDIYAVRLAGRMRLAEAVRPLIDFAAATEDEWYEDMPQVLAQLGSDEMVGLIRERWEQAPWDFRFTAACALEGVHTDAGVAACLELAAAEKDPYGQQAVAHRLLESAVSTFDPAAVEPARQFLLRAPHTRHSKFLYETDLRGVLVSACTLTGARFPEYNRWRLEEIENRAAAERRIAGIDPLLPLDAALGRLGVSAPPPEPAPPPDTVVGKMAAGRNDPCPCGSGRKFKKCCGK